MRSKEFAVDTYHSLKWDADLYTCTEYETEALGDLGLFDIMRVSCSVFLCLSFAWACRLLSRCNFIFSLCFQALVRMRALQIRWAAREVLVECLRTHLGVEKDKVMGYKEVIRLLNTKLKE